MKMKIIQQDFITAVHIHIRGGVNTRKRVHVKNKQKKQDEHGNRDWSWK